MFPECFTALWEQSAESIVGTPQKICSQNVSLHCGNSLLRALWGHHKRYFPRMFHCVVGTVCWEHCGDTTKYMFPECFTALWEQSAESLVGTPQNICSQKTKTVQLDDSEMFILRCKKTLTWCDKEHSQNTFRLLFEGSQNVSLGIGNIVWTWHKICSQNTVVLLVKMFLLGCKKTFARTFPEHIFVLYTFLKHYGNIVETWEEIPKTLKLFSCAAIHIMFVSADTKHSSDVARMLTEERFWVL
jgi:hypothetical protein